MINREKIESNLVYRTYKSGNYSYFYELMINTLISTDKTNKYGAIQYIKFLKDETDLKMLYCKDWFILLRELKFIIWDHNGGVFYITDHVNEINSMKELIYLVDHNLTVKEFLRGRKLKNLKKKMNE